VFRNIPLIELISLSHAFHIKFTVFVSYLVSLRVQDQSDQSVKTSSGVILFRISCLKQRYNLLLWVSLKFYMHLSLMLRFIIITRWGGPVSVVRRLYQERLNWLKRKIFNARIIYNSLIRTLIVSIWYTNNFWRHFFVNFLNFGLSEKMKFSENLKEKNI